ncbi:MAG: PEP-CTERM sorting domain-containing protein [Planctomycetota bacterium]|jgi:hypothetical protein
MRVLKINILFLLLLLAVCVQNSSATMVDILPESSHYDGSTYYNIMTDSGGYLKGRIDFAVYDTDNLVLADEIALSQTLNMNGQYIYAYQIFNDYPASDESVAYFAVFGINEDPLSVDCDSIDSFDDSAGGQESSNEYFTPLNTRGVWEFDGGLVAAGEHSWFLVFCSDHDWVKGDYELKAPEDDFPVPEPAMVMLFGLGGAFLLARRKVKA